MASDTLMVMTAVRKMLRRGISIAKVLSMYDRIAAKMRLATGPAKAINVASRRGFCRL